MDIKELEKQLDLLSIFHFIVGGVMALFSCIPLIHVTMGILIVSGKFFTEADSQTAPPGFFGWFFIVMGGSFVLLGWITSICIIVAGSKLKKRRNRTFCMIMDGILCMFMPLGTVLGVFSLIALTKDEARALFEHG